MPAATMARAQSIQGKNVEVMWDPRVAAPRRAASKIARRSACSIQTRRPSPAWRSSIFRTPNGKLLHALISVPSLRSRTTPTLRIRLGLSVLARRACCIFAPSTRFLSEFENGTKDSLPSSGALNCYTNRDKQGEQHRIASEFCPSARRYSKDDPFNFISLTPGLKSHFPRARAKERRHLYHDRQQYDNCRSASNAPLTANKTVEPTDGRKARL